MISDLTDLWGRLDTLDRNEPYVWRLRLSEEEFATLESALLRQAETDGKASLLSPAWALRTVAYLAEWYKRRYQGTTSHPGVELDTDELKTLWCAANLNQTWHLYSLDNGSQSWRYSLYVLGGLSLHLALANPSQLKRLCRLYRGEEDSLEKLDDAERAAAFRQSIQRHGSLHAYLQTILNGDLPFAQSELQAPDSLASRFVSSLQNAYEETFRDKFALEWRFWVSDNDSRMARALRLHLLPEAPDGAMRPYLSLERLRCWGLPHPERQRRLRVALRLLDGSKVVREPDISRGALTFSNTGDEEAGFVAWNVRQFVPFRDVPVCAISDVEVVLFDEQERGRPVQRLKVPEWMQVYRVSEGRDEWTSRALPQRETALLCATSCTLQDAAAQHRVLGHRQFGDGLSLLWSHIHGILRFQDSQRHEHILYTRQGQDQIIVRCHDNLLRYAPDGTVTFISQDNDEDRIHLLLGRDDVRVRHIEVRSSSQEDASCTEEVPDRLEFKRGARYVAWTDAEAPPLGPVTLRVTHRGREHLFRAYHCPLPLERDLQHGRLRIGSETLTPSLERTGLPLTPVCTYELHDQETGVRLELWQPTAQREIIRRGRVVAYVESGARGTIPYLLKDEMTIQEFGEDGYRSYDCHTWSSIYQQPEFCNRNNAYLNALRQGTRFPASRLADDAPTWLDVALTMSCSHAHLMRWNYSSDRPPASLDEMPENCPDNEIIFHSLRDDDGSAAAIHPYRLGEFDPWGWQDDIRLLDCFDVCLEHRLYFFAMHPFREDSPDFLHNLYQPLLERRQGHLTDEERAGLRRLSEEMNLDFPEPPNP